MRRRLRLLFAVVPVTALAISGLVPGAHAEVTGSPASDASAVTDNAVAVVELTDERGNETALADVDGEPTLITPEIPVSVFYVAGVTWSADVELADDTLIQLRVFEDGTWTNWLEAEIEDSPSGAPGVANGSEPFITGGATAVQLRISGQASPPPDLKLTLIPADAGVKNVITIDELPTGGIVSLKPEAEPSPSTDDAPLAASGSGRGSGSLGSFAPLSRQHVKRVFRPVATGVVPSTVATPAGDIVTRAEWGADESYTDANWTPKYFPLEAAVVHHTAGSNTYTAGESAGIVKGIFVYHALTRGWGDIGYNFLVDKYGKVFEGRKYSLTSQAGTPAGWMIEAGHASSYNKGSLGISAMGDFTLSTAPSSGPVLSSMARVIAWKFKEAGIDLAQSSAFVSPSVRNRNIYPTGARLPRIFGHGDVANTACPGNLYGQLPSLRDQVSGLLEEMSAFTDVPAGMMFRDEIEWMYAARISTGWDEADGTKTYRPALPVARDAMAAFLYRAAGSPAYTAPATSPFADITPSTQFYKEMSWMRSAGISTGWDEADGTRTYRPALPVARDAMAAFLYRAAGSPAYTAPATSPFTDITPSTQFYKEMSWMRSAGISTGWDEADGTKTYRPALPVARDTMAAFLHRAAHR